MSKYKVVKTAVVLSSVLVGGITTGTITTALPDMEDWTSSNTAEMSTVFVWSGLAIIVGTLGLGPLFDRVNGLLLLAACLLMLAATIALAPVWPSLIAFQTLTGLNYLFAYALMTGCLTLNLNTWRTSANWIRPVIQSTILMDVVGMALSPQIVRPYLSLGVRRPEPNGTFSCTSSTLNVDKPTLPTVSAAFFIVAALNAGMTLVCLATAGLAYVGGDKKFGGLWACLSDRGDPDEVQLIPDPSNTSTDDSEAALCVTEKLEPCSRQGCVLLALMYMFVFMNGGREVMISGLLFTYVYVYLGWNADSSALLVTICHLGSFGLHVIVASISRWARPTQIVVVNLVLVILSSALLAVAIVTADGTLMAVGIAVAATVTSSSTPTTITLVEEAIHVVAPIMALFISAFGSSFLMVGPLTGSMLQNVGMTSYPVTLMALALMEVTIFCFYSAVLRTMRPTPQPSYTDR